MLLHHKLSDVLKKELALLGLVGCNSKVIKYDFFHSFIFTIYKKNLNFMYRMKWQLN